MRGVVCRYSVGQYDNIVYSQREVATKTCTDRLFISINMHSIDLFLTVARVDILSTIDIYLSCGNAAVIYAQLRINMLINMDFVANVMLHLIYYVSTSSHLQHIQHSEL